MRTLSFVERLEFEYQNDPGSLFSGAMALGDVDNDGLNELVVGNVRGNLLIFKGDDPKPWKKATDLGMITSVVIGDICNHGMNYLLVCNAEGCCHIFILKKCTASQEEHPECIMKPAFQQHLPANCKVVMTADIDSDGQYELVIGFSDRIVKSFRWQDIQGESEVHGQSLYGKFATIEKWQLAGQIGSITVNKQSDGKIALLVAQPGGTSVSLLSSEQTKENIESPLSDKLEGPSLVYHSLGSSRLRNPGVTTEIIGNIRMREPGHNFKEYCALCTLDGTLMLLDGDTIIWSLQVDHQLFALNKFDITGDGEEEVIVTSWDGQTYIVNYNRDVVRFHFEDHTAAFCAGHYSVNGTENIPCLVYTTFNNQLYIYYNVRLQQLGSCNLLDVMKSTVKVTELLPYLGVDGSNQSQLRELYKWCIYGFHPSSHSSADI